MRQGAAAAAVARRQALQSGQLPPLPVPRRQLVRGRAVTALAPAVRCAPLPRSARAAAVRRRLRPAAARRRRPRRPPVHGDRRSSPTCSTWCRRPAVKVNDVAGRPGREVDLAGTAGRRVTVGSTATCTLPANAVAQLRQSSLLGEKYVELAAPDDGRAGRAGRRRDDPAGPHQPQPRGRRGLRRLSLLLNGGGIGQLQTITKELKSDWPATRRRSGRCWPTSNTLVTDLDAHRKDITRALDGLNRLSATLNDQQTSDRRRARQPDARAGDARPSSAPSWSPMLQSLDNASGVATDTVNAQPGRPGRRPAGAGADLQPAGRGRAETCRKSLQMLLTFPFPDRASRGVKGDYVNLAFLTEPRRPWSSNLGPPGRASCRSSPGADRRPGTRPSPLPLPTPAGAPAPASRCACRRDSLRCREALMLTARSQAPGRRLRR